MHLDPVPLITSHESVVVELVASTVEVLNYDSAEYVPYKYVADDHKREEVKEHYLRVVLDRLRLYSRDVNAAVHGIQPVLARHHLEESEHRVEDVIEVPLVVRPLASQVVAVVLRLDVRKVDARVCPLGLAVEELASEKVHSKKAVDEDEGESESQSNHNRLH